MKKVKNSELLLSYIREGRPMTGREKLALITQLSIPSILAQISATVMFFIDASMVGHLGAKASASIGLVETTGWLIGGLSHGGVCAMRACFEYPERYAAGLIMSAAGTDHTGPVEEAELRFDVYGLAEKNIREKTEMPRLIFATGSGDRGMPYYVPVIDRIEAMGIPAERYYVDGDGHSWEFWDSTVRKALDEMLPIRHDVI